SNFNLENFRHRAIYNTDKYRIEMHLVSTAEQTVTIDDNAIHFKSGESIHTENSYKYTLEGFRSLAKKAGFEVKKVWTDEKNLFSVQYLTTVS
ncbi:MAG: L-histidine N(alpha)-methyltransferase, partial [Gammaproteobacteria bacterium]|nr:L-histidine N(alpha)-methyltransferase [Gammaproteobacteria bacterium]